MARFTRRSIHEGSAESVAVLGLGRFGSSVALELMSVGASVLGVDTDEELVQRHNGQLTHVVRADSTDEMALEELSIKDFERVVVAIGSHLEASILTSSLLLNMGIREVWAKATSNAHGRILTQLGVPHVVYPEQEMGRRVAHRVRGALMDYIETGTDFALVRTEIPAHLAGGRLNEELAWERHRVKVVAVKSSQGWIPVLRDTILNEGDLVQVVGRTRDVEAFAQVR